ncbi:UNVERIFIED_CONTAM: hypothetical protein FKN15_020754 [Acipenser sinensis]
MASYLSVLLVTANVGSLFDNAACLAAGQENHIANRRHYICLLSAEADFFQGVWLPIVIRIQTGFAEYFGTKLFNCILGIMNLRKNPAIV